MSSYDVALTAYSRVFLVDGGPRPDHTPSYKSCLKAGSPDQSFGTVESIYCPDPSRYGGFVTMASLQGAEGRATIDVTGRYASDIASDLLEIAKRKCRADIQVHFGTCTDPSSFTTFTKAVIFEDARIENWSTGDLGALSQDENASIDEVASISAVKMYEVLPLSLTERAQSVVTNEVLDVVICDWASCGDCEDESEGCEKIYAITRTAHGSVGQPADVVHSVNKGVTWYADDIDSLGAGENPTAITCLGDYVVVVSNDSVSQHYALKSEVDTIGFDETWVEIATGYVATGGPNDCWSVGSVMFVVGDGGYIYLGTDATAGVTVLDAGAATPIDLYCVHAFSEQLAVAGGDDGALVYTEDQTSWQLAALSPVGVGIRINAVWCMDEAIWLVGCSNGTLWYTLDKGATWTQIMDMGAAIYDIAFSNDTVGYVAYASATRGAIRRTFSGAEQMTFKILPEGTGTIPVNARINAIAACIHDPNFVVGVGLAVDLADGFIVVGSD